MSDILLATKIRVPPLQSTLVSRPHLIQRLNDGIAQNRHLTLVSAPAGYGKSTLLSAWVSQAGVPVAWLSLEKAENTPARFWRYLLSALDTLPHLRQAGIGKSLLRSLQSPKPPPMDVLLANLVNDFAKLEGRAVLILDDLHAISSGQIHEDLVFLIEHLPRSASGLHLVVASRMDPPWPLARWRVRDELNELRLADLRFSQDEIVQFLNQVLHLSLSTNDIATLRERTEGWIASLQMAAVSMQGRLKTQGPEGVSRFIDTFAGSNRFILDYLIEEVISQQPAEISEFLHQTSILERFTASLCDAFLDRHDSQTVLRRIEQANLFLIPLDDERRWYRYHNLFADLLLNRLEQTQAGPDQVSLLHRRAAECYENEGLMTEAVKHALAGKDNDRLMRLVEANVYSLNPSDLSQVAEQLSALPDEITRAQPWILIARARALVESGHLIDVEPCLQKAEAALEGFSPRSDTELKRMKGYMTVIRGYCLAEQGALSQSIELLQDALEVLPKEDAATRSLAATVLSTSLRWTGHLAEGSRYGEEAVAMARLSGSINALVDVLGDLVILQILQGKLKRASETCRQAIQIVDASGRRYGQKMPVIGPVYTALSVILREWNDLKASLEYAQEGLRLCQHWGQVPNIFRAYYDLAITFQVSGDSDNAGVAIREAERVASGFSPWFISRAAILRPWQQLKNGDVPAATQWAQTCGLNYDDQFDFKYHEHYCLLAKVLLSAGKRKEALVLVDTLLKMADSAGALGLTVEALAIQALALSRASDHGPVQGEMESAIPCLKRALALAEPEGYVRTFADMGAPMAALLRLVRSHTTEPAYADKLLSAIEADLPTENVSTSGLPAGQMMQSTSLVEPLSARETQVLRLLASSLDTSEIAAELYISVSTVRSHIKSIYSKLNVSRRIQAVDRAHDLKLI